MNVQEQVLRDSLAASHRLGEQLDEEGFPLAELQILQDWQRARLADTYADLLSEPQYRAAGHFFLEELYGGLDFRDRDREVEHVLPVMVRMLPGHMLKSMADAFDLQSLSLFLDICMAECMRNAGLNQLNAHGYAILYRDAGHFDERRRQILLIHELGLELNELVRHRLVLRLIRLLRYPARAAGFGKLQNFLESGLFAFRAMHDGKRFVDTIVERETIIMEALQQGREVSFSLTG